MIVKKTPRQIEMMRRAGVALAEVHGAVKPSIRPDMRLSDLDSLVEKEIRDRGGVPSFLGYKGFPASVCASLNDVVVHGIPKDQVARAGDILSVDIGLILEGWHADCAYTYPVGTVSDEARRLLEVTEASLWAGIEAAQPGARVGDVSAAIQSLVEEAGFSVVREYGGHGIGRQMHEGDFHVMNFGTPGRGPLLEPGMVFALEPMVNIGGWQTRLLPDGWTVITADGSLSAHFEHTIAITREGPQVLTVG